MSIKIFKGDDTDFADLREITISLQTPIDLTGFSAEFRLQSFSQVFADASSGLLTVIIDDADSRKLTVGKCLGSLILTDATSRKKTVTNQIPFEIVRNTEQASIDADDLNIAITIEQQDITINVSVSTFGEELFVLKTTVIENMCEVEMNEHIAAANNPHTVTAMQVGLGNADNTSDADKPVSTAQQTALDLKWNAATTISVADASAMQVIIDAGTVKRGQLFSLVSDRSIRRFEGNGKSRVIADLPQANPTETIRMVSVKTTNLAVYVTHDGGDAATGICYSVDAGAPVYAAIAADTQLTLSVPHNDGAPVVVYIWAATSATSGRRGKLTSLYCNDNDITNLDVSRLTALIDLHCHANSLTSLDISGLTALITLHCPDNNLTSLDVSGLTALTSLGCSNNDITSLDLSSLTALATLSCHDNDIMNLDVSGLTALIELHCHANSLTSLNLSGLTALITLHCPDNNLTSLDVSGLTALTVLYCSNNDITSLDLSSLTALATLYCRANNSLSSVTAVGCDGAARYSSSYYVMDFQDCALTTDAVFDLLTDLAIANPSPSWINVTGNPCDPGDGAPANLVEDGTHTQAEVQALLTAKGYTLLVDGGAL